MFSWIFRNRSKLRPVETRVIDAIADALPADSAGLLRIQVSLINKVQRLDLGREVDFYRIEKGKPVFPNAALFPNRAEEFELARLRLLDAETGHQSKATVWLVKGRLFCIEFSHTPRDLSRSDLEVKIEQLRDPANAHG